MFLIFITYLSWIISNCLAIPLLELQLLQQLYKQTHGEQWVWRPFGPRWNFDVPHPNPCNTRDMVWQGLYCSSPPLDCMEANSSFCQITRIDLDLRQLQGPLLTNFTGFTRLLGLSVNSNNLTGPVPALLPPTLGSLWLSRNSFTGTIPSQLTLLPSISIIHLEANALVGTIPSEFGSLTTLRALYFSQNCLTGTIPSTLGQLTAILTLYLFSNSLTGTIPSALGSLSSISFLVMDVNSLTGPIPTALGLLTSLLFLDLDLNYLTGTLPSSLTNLSKIETFTLDGNLLSSTIPCGLDLLTALTYLDFDYNYFTSLCPSLVLPPSLEILDFSHNLIMSPVPSPLISQLSQLQLVDLNDNFFHGSLPSNLYVLSSLDYLGLGFNDLTGSLPYSLGQLTSLEQLYLEKNHFIGSLQPLLNLSFGSLLNSIDLSNNQFTGTLLSSIFALPKLQVLALTSNCFHGTLPHSICSASLLSILSLDGLGAGNGCSFKDSLLFSQFNFRNSFGGDIPSCLWAMANMTILSLSGNALTGTLHSLPSNSALINLTLSHNHLSGSIPNSFFQQPFQSLDLSYNKFSGEYLVPSPTPAPASGSLPSSPKSRRVVLEVNRLSGEFPRVWNHSNFDKNSFINILTGNIFACEQLPADDIHSDTYRCGSEILDYSLIMFGLLIGLLILLSSSALWILNTTSSTGSDFSHQGQLSHTQKASPAASVSIPHTAGLTLHWRMSLHQLLLLFQRCLSPEPLLTDLTTALHGSEILKSLQIFIYLQDTVKLILLSSLLATLPLYLLRLVDGQASTHTHLYRWVWTTAYFSGPLPSTLLLLSWIAVVSVFFFRFRRLKSDAISASSVASSNSDTASVVADTYGSSSISRALAPLSPLLIYGTRVCGPAFPLTLSILETLFILLINVSVMGTVNALYIISSNDTDSISSTDLFFIQFSFALFKAAWNKLCVPLLDLSKQSQRVKIVVSVLNSIFIPAIVISLTSPTCFQVTLPCPLHQHPPLSSLSPLPSLPHLPPPCALPCLALGSDRPSRRHRDLLQLSNLWSSLHWQ
jgi:Leucine-rich repeat (LRR) protein